ncbi:MAG: hypothetical protein JW996_07590 [Candidatus Cloacimonetes bacterium]|nr:hypothetical protein [Candidatus Cloacimonadota bacterium]
MKKILLILIVSSSLMFLGCAFGSIFNISDNDVTDKSNIVLNSSFEEGDIDMEHFPFNWHVLEEQYDMIRLDNTNFRSGNSSILIQNPDQKIALVSESFTIDPTSVYYSRCFVKSDSQTKKPLTLYLFAFNDNGDRVNSYSKEFYPGDDCWSKIDFVTGFFQSSATTGRIVINIPDDSEQNFWIDDAESYQLHRFAFSQE